MDPSFVLLGVVEDLKNKTSKLKTTSKSNTTLKMKTAYIGGNHLILIVLSSEHPSEHILSLSLWTKY